MDPKTLNALVHDREAAFYDERFAIAFDKRIGPVVARELERVAGEIPKAHRALDYCCGTGFAAVGMSVAGVAEEVHGCDLSAAMLERTLENAHVVGANVRVALCDGELLPYETDAFDLVVARGALHHLPDPVAGLREVRRVLRLGGTAIVLAEPTPSGERQVGALVGSLARVVERGRRILRRPVDAERHHWELASMAANLHTFTPSDVAAAALAAGFTDADTSAAAWAWVLALGLNYYASGESTFLELNPFARRARHAFVDAAAVFDRAIAERVVPPRFRHTVQAVLR